MQGQAKARFVRPKHFNLVTILAGCLGIPLNLLAYLTDNGIKLII